MPHWDDLRTDSQAGCSAFTGGCGIFTSVSGSTPNRIFNIEWRAVDFATGSGAANFEVRLYEGQTRFDVIYGAVSGNGGGATIGVQRDTGSRFTQFSCNTASLSQGLMLTFVLPVCGTATPSPTPTNTPPPIASGPFGFTGEPYAVGGQLIYLRARDYNPELGRFLTMDSHAPDPMHPQTFNKYTYANNNPVNLTDHTGEDVDPAMMVFGAMLFMMGNSMGHANAANHTGETVDQQPQQPQQPHGQSSIKPEMLMFVFMMTTMWRWHQDDLQQQRQATTRSQAKGSSQIISDGRLSVNLDSIDRGILGIAKKVPSVGMSLQGLTGKFASSYPPGFFDPQNYK